MGGTIGDPRKWGHGAPKSLMDLPRAVSTSSEGVDSGLLEEATMNSV